MTRTNPAQMRQMLVLAHDLAKFGILFVPMPVTTTEEFITRSEEMVARLEQIDKLSETEP
ncbi:DUF1382 family protein [Pseudomonas oryzihabitans]|uniref:DUF1382 family protein n=1 Tax=Pseudomonas oryzihabitans TaxID=47885 RepID=UPI0028A1265E|nr:DUF1382 family protein [Pseudomonas oryzihabitans]